MSKPIPASSPPGITNLLLACLLALSAGAAHAQPPAASTIDRISRERDALNRRTDVMARLRLTYRSSGELTSTFEKMNPQSLYLRAEVDGAPLKKIAKGKKPKVAEGVQQGVLWVEATWTRPGTRFRAECQTDLQVGFQEVLILPYGGTDNFKCEIVTRLVPEQVFEEWSRGLGAEEAIALADCSGRHVSGSAGFWACVDGAGLSFPPG